MTRPLRAAAELAGIVLAFAVVRELTGRAAVALARAFPDRQLGAVPFYAMWTLALVAVARFQPRPRMWPPRVAWNVATIALVVASVITVDSLYGFLVGRALVGDFNFHWPTIAVLNGVLAGVIEEWLFRGVLWDAIEARLPKVIAPGGALVLTSVLFGIFHWASMLHPSWYDGAGTTTIFAHAEFGAFVGIMRWRLRSIGPGMIVHIAWNTVAMLTF
jgi:membrane protease YdiL (CAAX protease family)